MLPDCSTILIRIHLFSFVSGSFQFVTETSSNVRSGRERCYCHEETNGTSTSTPGSFWTFGTWEWVLRTFINVLRTNIDVVFLTSVVGVWPVSPPEVSWMFWNDKIEERHLLCSDEETPSENLPGLHVGSERFRTDRHRDGRSRWVEVEGRDGAEESPG